MVRQDIYPVELLIIQQGAPLKKNKSAELQKAGLEYKLFCEDKFDSQKLRDYLAKECSGKYVMVLSDKDEYTPQFLPRMIQRAESVDADIVFCDFTCFKEENSTNENVAWSLNRDFLPEKMVFNASDCPEKILNITPLGIQNKLYKRKFLTSLEYEISEGVDGFLAFALEVFISANQITCIKDKLFSRHAVKKVEEMKDIIKERAIVKEFGDVYYFLMKKEAPFKKSFINYFIQKVYLLGLKLKEPFKSFWEAYIAEQVAYYFDMDGQNEEYFYNKQAYQWIDQLSSKQNLSSDLERVYMKNKENVIPVVMAINDNYTLYAGVAIQSIKEHVSKDKFYDIYVMYTWLKPESIKKLESLSEDCCRISCINVSSDLNGYSFEDKMNKELWHISQETFYRFLIPDLFVGYDKIIYLDADLIVQDDLAKLYYVKLGKNLLGGCYNPHWDEMYRMMENVLKIDPLSYINAGVLLINAKAWREEEIKGKCFQALSEYGTSIKYQDQDILNIVCQHRICLIDYQWNFVYSLYITKNSDYMRFLKNNAFCMEDLKIIHYTWWQKPWIRPENEMADIWWNYARKSPFYEGILLRRVGELIYDNKNSSPSPQTIPPKNTSPEKVMKSALKTEDSLLAQYIKEAVLFLVTWGKRRKGHLEKLRHLQAVIEEKVR